MLFARFSSKRAAVAPASSPPVQHDLRELARRAVARDIVNFHTVIAVEGLDALDARLMDISPYGFQCRATCPALKHGDKVWLLLPVIGERRAEVMWGLKGLFGGKFMEPLGDIYAELLPQLQGAHPGLLDRS
jgi:hypothetical protein